MPLIVEKLREIQRNSDFWTECSKVQNLQLNMEPLTSGHCVQKKKEFSVTCQHQKEMVHLMFMRTSATS